VLPIRSVENSRRKAWDLDTRADRSTVRSDPSARRGKGDRVPSPPCVIYGFYLLDACALIGQARVASQTGLGDPSLSHVSHNYNDDVIPIQCASMISSEVVQGQELGWNRATLAVPISIFWNNHTQPYL
jgi:hypothetical protein